MTVLGLVHERAAADTFSFRRSGRTPGAPSRDGLALVPFSNGVHDDFAEQPRRKVYRDLVADGSLGPGYATEDGVGLHYVGTSLSRVVTIRPAASAWWVEPDGRGGHHEERIPVDFI